MDDVDKTLPDILQNISHLSSTLRNISSTQTIQGMTADNFKDRVLTQLSDITKDVHNLFSTLSTSIKAENQSSTKVSALSNRLDTVNDNLSSKIESVRHELSSKIDSVATQMTMALFILQKEGAASAIQSAAVDNKGEENITEKS